MALLETQLRTFLRQNDALVGGPVKPTPLSPEALQQALAPMIIQLRWLVWFALLIATAVVVVTLVFVIRMPELLTTKTKILAAPGFGLMAVLWWMSQLIREYWRMATFSSCLPFIPTENLRDLIDKLLYAKTQAKQASRSRDSASSAKKNA